MKRIYLISTLLFVLLVNTVLWSQDSKINIAILDLDPTNIAEDDAKFLSDRLRIELFETGVFNVVERDKMNSILEEQGFQVSGCTSLECAVEIGQLLNVNQMVGGSIGKIENVYSITLRLIDVGSGALLRTAKRDFQGSLSDMLTEVIPDIANDLAQSKKESKKEKKISAKTVDHWGIQVKGGSAAFGLVGSINSEIETFNEDFTYANLPDFAQFNSFSIVLIWDYNQDWRYNFGLQASPLGETWNYRVDDFVFNGNNFSRVEFERYFTFVFLYAGADYKFNLTKSIIIYLGANLGFNNFASSYIADFNVAGSSLLDFKNDKKYSYTALALKLDGGIEYKINDTFSLFFEISPFIQTSFDTKDEFPNYSGAAAFREVIFPDEMNGSGIIGNLGLTVFF